MSKNLDRRIHPIAEADGLSPKIIVTGNKESTLALIPELRRRLSDIGVTLHPNKFYCQHYTKGVEFLGYHIKRDRVYINNRCVRNAMNKIKWFNKRVGLKNLDKFVSTVNSYLGRLKGCNGFNILNEAIDSISDRWWKYVYFDKERLCIVAKEGYTHKDRMIKKYNLESYVKRRSKKRDKQGGKPDTGVKELPCIEGLSDDTRDAGRGADAGKCEEGVCQSQADNKYAGG